MVYVKNYVYIFHKQNEKRTVNTAGVYPFIPLATST